MVLKYKLKGAYWSPTETDYFGSIANAQPPAWHKDLGNTISIRAAVDAMVNGSNPEDFIKNCTNSYDFMCRIKVNKSNHLLLDGNPIQRTSRYYVSTNGGKLVKTAPPTGYAGEYKKKNGVSESEYNKVMMSEFAQRTKVNMKNAGQKSNPVTKLPYAMIKKIFTLKI